MVVVVNKVSNPLSGAGGAQGGCQEEFVESRRTATHPVDGWAVRMYLYLGSTRVYLVVNTYRGLQICVPSPIRRPLCSLCRITDKNYWAF